ncbi:MAG: LLM class flavin-dependent oxidoreductase [Gemmatimonadetes bacterium]|nr:LLM class flavin-dependent oxidoreductase [Gemmatimonadota bacterium]
MELGIYSFGDVPMAKRVGPTQGAEERLAHLLAEIELADQVGLDVFGVGEHHRPDFVVSNPEVVLAAAAARTSRIRLTSAVTVLSSDDPVRVFEAFATLDLLSHGRAEIMAGRGSFIESFPLFGYDLGDYDALFAEKLELLLQLRDAERVTWQGTLRAPLANAGVYPRPVQQPLPVWIAVGGTPESVVRAGMLGLPLAIAIIGGQPERFAPLAGLHREAVTRGGRDPRTVPLSINSHGFIARTDAEARALFEPGWRSAMTLIGRERGWPPPRPGQFEAECGPDGALLVGSPETVARKILTQHGWFGHQRFLLQLSVGGVPHDAMLEAIRLYGHEVKPMVLDALGVRAAETARVGAP